MLRKFILVLFFSFFSTQAYCFSLVNDWSNIINPNGPWSFNEGNDPLQYNISGWPTNEFGPTQTAWANSNIPDDGFVPAWFKSVVDPNSAGSFGTYDWLAGDVIVHSTSSPPHGANHGSANVTWTSPASRNYDIEGGLWAGRESIDKGNNWILSLDDLFLASGNVDTGDIYSRAIKNSFSFTNIYIPEGRILKLEVIRSNGLDGGGDFVGVNLEIHPVPEPTTIILFGGGLLGAYLRRRMA